jgi:hypothetical protein
VSCTVHVVQVFDWDGAQLVPGDCEITTRQAAERRAKALAESHAGAIAIALLQGHAGTRSAMLLAAFGELPEPYAEGQAHGWTMSPISKAAHPR